jgi:hypothetical protein
MSFSVFFEYSLFSISLSKKKIKINYFRIFISNQVQYILFFSTIGIFQVLFGFVCCVVIGFGFTKTLSLQIFCILCGENLFHVPKPGKALP